MLIFVSNAQVNSVCAKSHFCWAYGSNHIYGNLACIYVTSDLPIYTNKHISDVLR